METMDAKKETKPWRFEGNRLIGLTLSFDQKLMSSNAVRVQKTALTHLIWIHGQQSFSFSLRKVVNGSDVSRDCDTSSGHSTYVLTA